MTKTIDTIEVIGEHKHIHIRELVVDGENSFYHRRVISPNDDTTNEPQEIKDVVTIQHTQDIKDSYNTYLQSVSI
jgi:hypothetical protein